MQFSWDGHEERHFWLEMGPLGLHVLIGVDMSANSMLLNCLNVPNIQGDITWHFVNMDIHKLMLEITANMGVQWQLCIWVVIKKIDEMK